MNGFKPNAKMSSTCHYSYGGAVMKKAKGGKVMGKSYFEDIPDKENDLLVPGDENSPTIKEDRENRESGTALYEKLYNKDKSDNNTKVGKIMKKATGGAMKQAYQTQVRRNPRDNGVALGPDDRPLGMPTKPKGGGGMMGSPVKPKGGMMGNGPFGPRNPNGPRKPMGSPSPMSGGIMAGMNSMLKGPMARKKGGMAKGMK